MATHGRRLRAAFESGDLKQLVALLDERVVWRGPPGSDYGRRGDTRILADDHYHASDHRGDHEEGGHDCEQVPLWTGRQEVSAILEGFLAPGGREAMSGYTVCWPVRQYELDRFGHVNNAVYLSWIEQAATDHAEAIGFGIAWAQAQDRAWVVREHRTTYRRPLVYGDVVLTTIPSG